MNSVCVHRYNVLAIIMRSVNIFFNSLHVHEIKNYYYNPLWILFFIHGSDVYILFLTICVYSRTFTILHQSPFINGSDLSECLLFSQKILEHSITSTNTSKGFCPWNWKIKINVQEDHDSGFTFDDSCMNPIWFLTK